MNDEVWAPFDRLVRLPATVAIEVHDAWRAGGGDEDISLDRLFDDELTELRRRLQIAWLMEGQTDASTAARSELDRVRTALAERGLPTKDAPNPPQVLQRLGALFDTMHRARLQVAARAEDAEKTIADAETEARALRSNLLGAGADEIPAYLIELQLLRAEAKVRGGDTGQARVLFEQAHRDASSLDDPILISEVVNKYASWAFSSADLDQGLKIALPLLDRLRGEKQALARSELLVLLARAYARVGDTFEAARTADMAHASLDGTGFPDTSSGDYLDVVGSWSNAAARVAGHQSARHRAFLAAALAYFGLAAVRLQLAENASSGIEARMEALRAFMGEASARAERIANADSAVLEERQREELGDTDFAFGTMKAPAAPDLSLLRRFAQLRQRAEADEASPELLAELDTLIADARAATDAMVTGYGVWTRAMVRWGTGDPRGAGSDYTEALDVGETLSDAKLVASACMELALLQIEGKDDLAASQTCGRGIAFIEAQRARVTPAYLQSGFMGRSTRLYSMGVMTARKAGETALMFERAELLKARALSQLQRHTPDEASGLRTALDEIERQLAQATDDAEREDIRSRRRLLWDQFSLARGQAAAPRFDLPRLQRSLGGGSVILYYFFLAREVLLVTLITEEQVETQRLVLDRPERLSDLLSRFATATAATPLDADLSALRGLLMPEAFEDAISRASQVLICAHQLLHQAPMHALPWGGRYLIELKPVLYVPNLSCLLQEETAEGRDRRLFALGTDIAVNGDVPSALPRLQHIDAEMARVVAAWQRAGAVVTALLNADATRNRFREAARSTLPAASVIHLCLHGGDVAARTVADTPMETQIHLRDGPIDGLEISRLNLNADLVVMAACFAGKRAVSGRGMAVLPADTAYGLQAAFHAAGARAVLGALWEADDKASAEILGCFHECLAAGAPAAAALQQSLRAFLDASSTLKRRPGRWAWCTLTAFAPSMANLKPEGGQQ